jgi:hypothetical protein
LPEPPTPPAPAPSVEFPSPASRWRSAMPQRCHLGLIVWCRHQVEPPPGIAERYGALHDGAGPGASAALLALRSTDVVVIGTKRR